MMISARWLPLLLAAGLGMDASAEGLVVHEWGTLTSVVGEDGVPISWPAAKRPARLRVRGHPQGPPNGHRAHGDACPLLLCGPGDRSLGQGRLSRGPDHRVVSGGPVGAVAVGRDPGRDPTGNGEPSPPR